MAPTTPTGSLTMSELPTLRSNSKSDTTCSMEPNDAMGSPTWIRFERVKGMPTSWEMSSPRASMRAPRAPATADNSSTLCLTGVADHDGKACFAAATALSMSSVVPSGTLPITASVVESMTSMDPSLLEGTHAPPMNSLSRTIAVVVSMVFPLHSDVTFTVGRHPGEEAVSAREKALDFR
jgi:hypothetical protein